MLSFDGILRQDWGMELGMAALLAAAFAYRNIISLVCVGFVAIGMASAPQTCARLWRVLVRGFSARPCLPCAGLSEACFPSRTELNKQLAVPQGTAADMPSCPGLDLCSDLCSD